ncbi:MULTISPECIES: hypothetical protein [unclassified Pseudomonas]|uniref:hypothetical protein n=1 Tax=unclassified Pseudomonas TaxID=196821 RepID=UPI00128B8034|nr:MULTISPECIES: hypothetical protein [unclassified Pseudomonas]MPQ65365.1 hypothetical protein [Pseudomonas sp. MWU12-2323]
MKLYTAILSMPLAHLTGVRKKVTSQLAFCGLAFVAINAWADVDKESFDSPNHDVVAYQKRFLHPRSNSADVGGLRVAANGCVTRRKIGTLNPVLDPKSWTGSKFLILDASFKNTSTTSRYPSPGAVIISKNGQTYKFDKFEMVAGDGFGVLSEALNPLITYRTKLVYRIPADLTGAVVWQPDDRSTDVMVSCGSI